LTAECAAVTIVSEAEEGGPIMRIGVWVGGLAVLCGALGWGLVMAAGGDGASEPPPSDAAIVVRVERLLSGYAGGTLTYAVGRATNRGEAPLNVLKIIVPVRDEKGSALGEATAVILHLPAGATVPFVAEWRHEADVRGIGGVPRIEINPPDVLQDLPVIVATDPMPIPDRNAWETGQVRLVVTNRGSVSVAATEVSALLLDETGHIIGAAKEVIGKVLEPNKPEGVSILWTQCAGHLVRSAEVWAQPAR